MEITQKEELKKVEKEEEEFNRQYIQWKKQYDQWRDQNRGEIILLFNCYKNVCKEL